MADAEEPMFDPSLKKKKPKKKTVVFNEEPEGPTPTSAADAPAPGPSILKPSSEEPAPAVAEDVKVADATAALDDLGFGELKKKKKKKIPTDFDMDAAPASAPPGDDGAEAAAPAGDELNDFSDLKKKKKKSTKKLAFDIDAFEKELGDKAGDGEEADDGLIVGDEGADLGDDVFAMPSAPVDIGDAQETWHGTDRDYTYSELLGRIVKTLRAQNPDLSSGRKRYTIVPPSLHRDGTKKTVFANISDICKRMHRQPEHVIQFIFAELGTNGTVDGSQRLVIKGRFQQKQIETVLRRYIVEYVTCKICKSPDTLLSKENRLYFMTCESCGSRRSVSAIKTGFQAQVGKRVKPAT